MRKVANPTVYAVYAVATVLSLAACGDLKKAQEDEEDSDTEEGPADPVTGTLRTATFSVYPVTPFTKAEAEAFLGKLDLTNYRSSTSTDACIRAKTPFTELVDGEASTAVAKANEDVDVTDCYAADTFPDLTEVTVTLRAVEHMTLKINDEDRYLVGRDVEFARESLKASDVESYELKRYSQSILTVKGNSNGANFVRRELKLSQNGDGKACIQSQAKGDGTIVFACAHFFAWEETVGDGPATVGAGYLRNDLALAADGYTSKYFNRGSKVDVAFGNWKGTIAYSGADVEPDYLVKDDGEGDAAGTIESKHFDSASAPALEIASLTVRGGCYVGTPNCDIEIDFTLNAKDEDIVSPIDYQFVYAVKEGKTPPDACTAENVASSDVLVHSLIMEDAKPVTNYAFRACVYYLTSGDYSPGVTAKTKTPALISD